MFTKILNGIANGLNNNFEIIYSRYSTKTSGSYLCEYYNSSDKIITEYDFSYSGGNHTITSNYINFIQNAHTHTVSATNGWYLYVLPAAYFNISGYEHLTPFIYDCGQNGTFTRDSSYYRNTQLYIVSEKPLIWANE